MKTFPLLALLFLLLPACTAPPSTSTPAPPSFPTQTALVSTEPPTLAPTSTYTPAPSQFIDLLDDLAGTEIGFWHVWDRSVGDGLQSIVDEFNASNEYGITVLAQHQGSYGDIYDNMISALTTGETPDLVVGYNDQYLAWDSLGNLMVDLLPYVNDSEVGFDAAALADFYPAFWAQDDIGDRRLGIPAQSSGQIIFYNLSWARELGFDSPPTTPDEFKEQACASSSANGDGTGGWFINTSPSTVAAWIFAFGGEFEIPGEGYNFNTPETYAAFQFLHDLYASGCAWRPKASFPNDEFSRRQGLFYTSSIAGIPFQLDSFRRTGSTDEWTVIGFPSVSGQPIIDVFGPSISIVKGTPEEQLAAWLFIKFFTEPENQAAWVQVSGYFPTRAGTEPLLTTYAANVPQWAAARDLLPQARFEPRFQSWFSVRSALQDAAYQLFSPGFDPLTIPNLLADLDATAAELHAETR